MDSRTRHVISWKLKFYWQNRRWRHNHCKESHNVCWNDYQQTICTLSGSVDRADALCLLLETWRRICYLTMRSGVPESINPSSIDLLSAIRFRSHLADSVNKGRSTFNPRRRRRQRRWPRSFSPNNSRANYATVSDCSVKIHVLELNISCFLWFQTNAQSSTSLVTICYLYCI